MQVRLPNGMKVRALGRLETGILYHECFVKQDYHKHGIELHEGDTIIDVGANIGLFTLYVGQTLRDFTLYAFEPLPATFRALKANTAALGRKVKLYNLGLSDRPGRVEFTFYPRMSCLSSCSPDSSKVRATVLELLEARFSFVPADGLVRRAVRRLGSVASRPVAAFLLRSRKIPCELRRLSDVLAAESVDRIDLLKVDAEGCEWQILQGIDESHWNAIRQIIVEVHDVEGRGHGERIVESLRQRGYEVCHDHDSEAVKLGLSLVYARRGISEPPPASS